MARKPHSRGQHKPDAPFGENSRRGNDRTGGCPEQRFRSSGHIGLVALGSFQDIPEEDCFLNTTAAEQVLDKLLPSGGTAI